MLDSNPKLLNVIRYLWGTQLIVVYCVFCTLFLRCGTYASQNIHICLICLSCTKFHAKLYTVFFYCRSSDHFVSSKYHSVTKIGHFWVINSERSIVSYTLQLKSGWFFIQQSSNNNKQWCACMNMKPFVYICISGEFCSCTSLAYCLLLYCLLLYICVSNTRVSVCWCCVTNIAPNDAQHILSTCYVKWACKVKHFDYLTKLLAEKCMKWVFSCFLNFEHPIDFSKCNQ